MVNHSCGKNSYEKLTTWIARPSSWQNEIEIHCRKYGKAQEMKKVPFKNKLSLNSTLIEAYEESHKGMYRTHIWDRRTPAVKMKT